MTAPQTAETERTDSAKRRQAVGLSQLSHFVADTTMRQKIHFPDDPEIVPPGISLREMKAYTH